MIGESRIISVLLQGSFNSSIRGCDKGPRVFSIGASKIGTGFWGTLCYSDIENIVL